MNLRKAVFVAGAWLLTTGFVSAQNVDPSKNKQPDWQKLLKKSPLPAMAVKMIKIREFPTEAMEEAGGGIGKALSLNIDHQGHIYAPDFKYNFIHKFNMNGETLSKIGRAGQGPGEFNMPRKGMFDREGNYYIEDAGRRILKFDQADKYVEAVKIFKPYSDFLFGENGKIYAGYSSRNPKEDHLIEILNLDGSLDRSFGKKKEFKYRSPSHNEVFLASGDHQIFVLWSLFNIFQRYSPEGELLFDGKLKYDYFDEISKENDDLMKPDDGGGVTSRKLFLKIRYCGNRLFTMTDYPRIVIYEFDQVGNLKKAYWADIQERELSCDFHVFERNGETFIVVLRSYPTNRIVLYSIPK